jgi:hypothetical protein
VPVIYRFTGVLGGLRQNEAPSTNIRLFPDECFDALFSLKLWNCWWKTNRYYHQYLEVCDEGCFLLHDVTIQEMYLFLFITAHLGHNQRDSLKDYWSTLWQIFVDFYVYIIKCDRFFQIFTFEWQQKLTWLDKWKLWQIVENERYFWWAEWCIC